MKKFKKSMAILLSAAVVLTLGAGFSASAVGSGDGSHIPHTIFVTFNGDPHTARGLTWFTDVDGLKSQVKVWTKSDLSDMKIFSNTGTAYDGNSYPVNGGDRTAAVNPDTCLDEYGHKVLVTGLTKGTTYYYEVGDTTDGNGLSKYGSFTTEGDGNSFSFIDVTDTQASVYGNDAAAANADYASNWAPLIAQAFKTVPDASFVMDNGDMTENGGDLKQWNLFTSVASKYLMNTTFVPVAGNHETYLANLATGENSVQYIANSYSGFTGAKSLAQGGVPLPDNTQSFGIAGAANDAFLNHFYLTLPDASQESVAQSRKGAYYSYNYGNAHFIVLNTNDLVPTSTYSADGKTETTVGGTLSAAQLSWLNADLATSAATSAKWKIVVFHRAVESMGSHVGQADIVALRAQLLPLMAKDNIDLVLEGHDRSFLRSKQINASVNPVDSPAQITEMYNGVKTTFDVNATGTVYIIPGAADNKFYLAPTVANLPSTIFPAISVPAAGGTTLDNDNDPAGTTEASKPTYSAVKIDGDKLTVTTYQYVLSTQTQNVLDTYSLAKPDAQTALVNQINALPSIDTLTIKDGPAVKAAYAVYNALDPLDQVMVTNSDTLLNDKNLIDQLSGTTTTTNTNPATGSNDNGLLFIILGIISAALLTSLVVFRKKLLKHN